MAEGHVPPQEVRDAAKRGLELRREFGRGGTLVGVARARDLSGGRAVSDDTISRMVSYFARHEVDKQGENWGNQSDPSAGYIAWLLWGGDPGRTWAKRVKAELDDVDKSHHPGTHHAGGALPAGGGGGTTTLTMPDGSKREAVTTKHDGTTIVMPKDMDAKRQLLRLEDVKSGLNEVPPEHRGLVKEVRVLDTAMVTTGGKTNKNALASYNYKTGVVEVYRTDGFKKLSREEMVSTMNDTIRHEAAHALDNKLGKPFRNAWMDAMAKERGAITDYAKTHPAEDLAETVMHYWSPRRNDRRVVDMFFPERAAVLKKFGVKAGG